MITFPQRSITLDEEVARQRQRATGAQLTVEPNTYEYTDPHAEYAIYRKWLPVCEEIGIIVMGVTNVPVSSIKLAIDGITFNCKHMNTGLYSVPESVYFRYRKAQEFSIPFAHWLWGEEQYPSPQFTVDKSLAEIPASRTFQQQYGLTLNANEFNRVAAKPAGNSAPVKKKRDPVLIGIIPTAPNRGIYCIFGRWFH